MKLHINDKKEFKVSEEIRKEMEKIYKLYINKNSNIIVTKYKNIKFPELDIGKETSNNISSTLFSVIYNGFKEYEFENSKKDYNNIKYLSFIFLCYYHNEAGNLFHSFYQIILIY